MKRKKEIKNSTRTTTRHHHHLQLSSSSFVNLESSPPCVLKLTSPSPPTSPLFFSFLISTSTIKIRTLTISKLGIRFFLNFFFLTQTQILSYLRRNTLFYSIPRHPFPPLWVVAHKTLHVPLIQIKIGSFKVQTNPNTKSIDEISRFYILSFSFHFVEHKIFIPFLHYP